MPKHREIRVLTILPPAPTAGHSGVHFTHRMHRQWISRRAHERLGTVTLPLAQTHIMTTVRSLGFSRKSVFQASVILD